MTEEEAKTKWCPQIKLTSAQQYNDVVYGDNRDGGGSNVNCIASDCMMWKIDEGGFMRDGEFIEGKCGLTR